AAGNASVLTRTFTLECGFENGLADWMVDVGGGSDPGRGSVSASDGQAILREGNSFSVTLERTLDIPASARFLSLDYSELSFDASDPSSIKDAFEAALVDAQGRPIAATIGSGRDAFFNVTEGQAAALGAGASIAGGTVTLDLSQGVPARTATL